MACKLERSNRRMFCLVVEMGRAEMTKVYRNL